MMTVVDIGEFTRVLGRELRRARQARRIAREQLIAGLDRTLSLATISTYEQGTRYISLVRFLEICVALGVPALEVFQRAYQQVARPSGQDRLWVDLGVVAQIEDPVLAPLRNWAVVVLRTSVTRSTTVHLGSVAVSSLAVLCGIDKAELATRLNAATTPPGEHRIPEP